MKKSTFWKLMLMLLPIAAVGLATTPDSVMAFDTQTGITTYYSYFELADVGSLKMAAPMAAVLSLVSGILAAVYLGAREGSLSEGAVWTAFASAVFAAVPVLIQGTVKVVPHVLLPILMLCEAALAYTMAKKPVQDEKNAPRLGKH